MKLWEHRCVYRYQLIKQRSEMLVYLEQLEQALMEIMRATNQGQPERAWSQAELAKRRALEVEAELRDKADLL